MKIIISIFILSISLSTFADEDYNRTCARRYIDASKSLVKTANDFNNALISRTEYASRVALAGSAVNGLRVFCMNENRQAIECVKQTKKVYKKIRAKMYVREIVKGNFNQVEVSDLDLVPLSKGAVKGFFKKLFRGEKENLCAL